MLVSGRINCRNALFTARIYSNILRQTVFNVVSHLILPQRSVPTNISEIVFGMAGLHIALRFSFSVVCPSSLKLRSPFARRSKLDLLASLGFIMFIVFFIIVLVITRICKLHVHLI